ncbi:MAG: 7TM-DISM domain-containing protein [Cytophagales bacterium]|nr:7TM-DISM domain-containing protein [Cytophagales bacterium]
MHVFSRCIILLACLFLYSGNIFSQDTYTVDGASFHKYRLLNTKDIPDSIIISTPDSILKYEPISINYVAPNEQYWIYVKGNNSEKKNVCLVTLNDFPVYDIYQVDKSGKILKVEKFGYQNSSKDKRLQFISHVFAIDNTTDEYRIFIKLKGLRFATGFPLEFTHLHNAVNEEINMRDMLFFKVGIVLFTIAFSMLLWIRFWSWQYLYFTLFCVSFLGYIQIYSKNIHNYFSMKNYIVGYDYFSYPYVSMIIFIVLFAASYIELSRYKFFYYTLLISITIRLLIYLYSLYNQEIIFFHPAIDNISLFIVLIAYIKYMHKVKTSWIVFIALLIMAITFLFHTSSYFGSGYYQSYLVTFFNIQTVGFVVFVLFSISVVAKFWLTQQEKTTALNNIVEVQAKNNRELERLVEIRTKTIMEQAQEIADQADKIQKMNELLKIDNTNLKVNIEEVKHAQMMHKNVSFDDFLVTYPDNEACQAYLHELKIEKNIQFVCNKCGNSAGTFIAINYGTRCTKCGYLEPVTYNTVYYNVKFPLNKAFYLTYLISTNQVYTLENISKIINLRKQTCFTFINKLKNIKIKKHKMKPGEEGWINYIFTDD